MNLTGFREILLTRFLIYQNTKRLNDHIRFGSQVVIKRLMRIKITGIKSDSPGINTVRITQLPGVFFSLPHISGSKDDPGFFLIC